MWIDASFLLFVWLEKLWQYTTSYTVTHKLGFSKEDMRQQSIQSLEPTDGRDTNGWEHLAHLWALESHLSTGWLRSVGSIKLYVSFAEYLLFHRALLQKRPVILLILLTEGTSYHRVHSLVTVSSDYCRYHVRDMGWLRLVGSFNLQVSFAKEPFNSQVTVSSDVCRYRIIDMGWLRLVGSFIL